MTSDFEGAVAKSTNVYIVVKQGFEVPVYPVHSVYDHCECDQMFWSFRTESDHEDLVELKSWPQALPIPAGEDGEYL